MLNEPSVVAVNTTSNELLAVGHQARRMLGRTPGHIVARRPLRMGAITDFEMTQDMIRILLRQVGVSRINRARVVVCVPSAITPVERRAVMEAARRAGAIEVRLIDQPLAAAIGAGLPIDEPVGSMVVDIGGGTTQTALLSLGGIVALEAVRVGSFDIDDAIQAHMRREYGMAIGEPTAEHTKIVVGSAARTRNENAAEIRGRELMSGMPKTTLVTPEEIRRAIDEPVGRHGRRGPQLLVAIAARVGPGPDCARRLSRRRRGTATGYGHPLVTRVLAAGATGRLAARDRRQRRRSMPGEPRLGSLDLRRRLRIGPTANWPTANVADYE